MQAYSHASFSLHSMQQHSIHNLLLAVMAGLQPGDKKGDSSHPKSFVLHEECLYVHGRHEATAAMLLVGWHTYTRLPITRLSTCHPSPMPACCWYEGGHNIAQAECKPKTHQNMSLVTYVCGGHTASCSGYTRQAELPHLQ